nr:hypothetical protein [uncultured Tyzzerella sp.]
MLIKKCLLNIFFAILVILNSFYIYNEFDIYLKKENYKFRYFANPKYDKIWIKEGARFGFKGEFGRSTIRIDISNENVSSAKTVLTTKDGWGSAPGLVDDKDYAKLYPDENPTVDFDIYWAKKENINTDVYICLDDTLEDYNSIHIVEEHKFLDEDFKNLRMYKVNPYNDRDQIIFYDISKNIKEERFNQEKIKMDIENLTGLTTEEIDSIGNEVVENFNKIYKNVLYQATILKIIKVTIIILLQITLYKYLKYKLLILGKGEIC